MAILNRIMTVPAFFVIAFYSIPNANGEPRNLWITLNWDVPNNSAMHSNIILQIIVDANRVFLHDSMLGNLTDSVSRNQRALVFEWPTEIQRWKCADHTHNGPADQRLQGMHFRLCARMLSDNRNNILLEYNREEKDQFDVLEQTRLSVELLDTICRAQIVASQSSALEPQGKRILPVILSVQSCIYASHCIDTAGGRVCE